MRSRRKPSARRNTVVTITPSTSYFDDGAVVPGTVYDFAPDGLTLAVPVTMTIACDAARIPSSIAEADLRIHEAHPASWSEIAGGALDPGVHLARADVSSFSAYGVLALRRSSTAPSACRRRAVPSSRSQSPGARARARTSRPRLRTSTTSNSPVRARH